MSEPAKTEAPEPPKKRAISLAFRLGLLAVAFVIVHSFLLEVFVVSGASMEPTLHESDRLLVWKATRSFHRGELVVFTHPMEDGRVLVKRVVGLPGEKVELRAGKLFANGIEMAEPWLTDRSRASFLEHGPVVVPGDCYFVLGDNRTQSRDSRAFGPLEASRIIGHALVVVWPPRSVN